MTLRRSIRVEYRLKKKQLIKDYKTTKSLNKKTKKEELKCINKDSKRVYKKEYKLNKKLLKKEFKKNKKTLVKLYVDKLDNNFDTSKDAPYRRTLEEIGNAVSHGLGTIFSIVALILMLINSKTFYQIISAIVYFIGLFILFTASTLYHAFPYATKVKRVFRRFDYSSIYLLIGATYAPILLNYLGGNLGLIFFITQWVIIITGISLIGVFGPGKLKAIHFVLYILLGWSGILFLPKMFINDFVFFIFILFGGIIYTLGIIPFSIDKKVTHFLWHLFVLVGAIVQFIGIFIFLF